jgi:hypothetical protein
MTFEQWWAHETWDGIEIATVKEAAIVRGIAANCWNTAIDKAQETVNFDPQDHPPYDLILLKVKL